LTHEGRECVAVIVPGSANRPHFAGRAYVRNGTETNDASEQQFDRLIADRTSRGYFIRQWLQRQVTVIVFSSKARLEVTLEDCNQFYATWREQSGRVLSVPLDWVKISYSNEKQRLELYLMEHL
jgi:hypothetical protein